MAQCRVVGIIFLTKVCILRVHAERGTSVDYIVPPAPALKFRRFVHFSFPEIEKSAYFIFMTYFCAPISSIVSRVSHGRPQDFF